MGISRHRRKTKEQPRHRLIRAGDRTMTFVRSPEEDEMDGVELPSAAEIDAALNAAPDELSWDWARARLIPLFERDYAEGVNGDPMVNSVSHLGVGIGYGIDLGPVFGRVTRSMAARWEVSVEQLEHAAFAHLAEVAATIGRGDLQSVVHHGYFFRALGEPAGWASSLVLADPSQIIRIFGMREATFTTPSRNSLLAFGSGTPARAVDEVTFQLGSLDPHPLRLDPFVMEDGVMRWEGLDADIDDVI